MIEIYGKPMCPYCDKAKALCEQNGYEYVYKQLDVDFTREELFEAFPGANNILAFKNTSIASGVDGILAPSEIHIHPLLTRVSASVLFNSF